MSYCDYCASLPPESPDVVYHDTEYGFPVHDDRLLFERLLLEIMQAGLSWSLILRRRAALRAAFCDCDPHRIAALTAADIDALCERRDIIRNRRKIVAVIGNAREVLRLGSEYGSFDAWLNAHAPRDLRDWVLLFREHFDFVGPEIVREFLTGIGLLPGAHSPACPAAQKIAALAAAHAEGGGRG